MTVPGLSQTHWLLGARLPYAEHDDEAEGARDHVLEWQEVFRIVVVTIGAAAV
jgi:hypothetical protein